MTAYKPILPIFERLKEIRTYYGYSQSEIAKILNTGKSIYANWEINKRLIPLNYLVDLSNIYKINIDYLVGLTDTQIKIESAVIDREIISINLKRLMAELNLSIKEFANSIKYSERTIYNYLNKGRLIPTYVIYDIARKYNVSIDYMLGNSNKKNL